MYLAVMEHCFRIRANSPSFVCLNRSCQLPLLRTFCLFESNPKRHSSGVLRQLVNAKSDMFHLHIFPFQIFLQTVISTVVPGRNQRGVHLESPPSHTTGEEIEDTKESDMPSPYTHAVHLFSLNRIHYPLFHDGLAAQQPQSIPHHYL